MIVAAAAMLAASPAHANHWWVISHATLDTCWDLRQDPFGARWESPGEVVDGFKVFGRFERGDEVDFLVAAENSLSLKVLRFYHTPEACQKAAQATINDLAAEKAMLEKYR
jgi:hypothetical protein